MLRNAIVALFLWAFAATSVLAEVAVPPGTTLIILRHSDRTGEDLNAKGIVRSEALVPALAGIGIDAIFSPGIRRNLDTAAPLSTARGLPVQRIPAKNPAAALMAKGGGKTIVWIGNKGNLRSIWADIAAPGPPPLEYGDLFIVTLGNGALHVDRRRFGP